MRPATSSRIGRDEAVLRQAFTLWSPPEKISVSEHARKKRYVSSETSNDSGPWDNDRTPHLVEIMDCFTDPAVEEIVFMKPARIGGTEVLNNAIGYYIDVDPCPILYVQQVEALAERYSKKIFTPMVRDNPHLACKVSLTRSRNSDNTILEKGFPGGDITMVGANSHTGMRMVSKRIVICDDIDGFPLSAGKEGDPVDLAIKRADTFRGVRKYYLTSSPSLAKTSRIAARYEATDKRIRLVPCPHCGTMQELIWGDDPKKHPQHLKWPGGKTFLAWYECPFCKGEIHEKHKEEIFKAGEWKATAEFKGKAGFKISGLYSPFRTWGELIDKFLDAYKEKDTNPEKLKVFVNTDLGEVWEENASDRKEDHILRLRDDRPEGLVPSMDIAAITCVADMQKRGFWYKITAWGFGLEQESWTLKAGFIDTWEGLRRIMFESQFEDVNKQLYNITLRGMDSGGGEGEEHADLSRTAEAYLFAAANPGVVLFKGRARMTRQFNVTPIDRLPGSNKPLPGSAQLYTIHSTFFKDKLAGKLLVNPSDPGAWHLHKDIDEDFARQMCAEYKNDHGLYECPKGKANHYFDCGQMELALVEIAQVKLWARPETQIVQQSGRRVRSSGVQ
jgi:terminase, large subunit